MHETPSWTAPYRLAVALRLLRARKINLISIVGVMLGFGSIIVVMSVMDGFQMELRDMIRGTLSYVIVEFDAVLVPRVDEIRAEVGKVQGVEASALQLHTVGIIPAKHRGIDGGVDLVWIDPVVITDGGGPPPCVEIGHDEDSDGVDDECDPCPFDSNNDGDVDADGIATACDPEPNVPNERLLFSGLGPQTTLLFQTTGRRRVCQRRVPAHRRRQWPHCSGAWQSTRSGSSPGST